MFVWRFLWQKRTNKDFYWTREGHNFRWNALVHRRVEKLSRLTPKPTFAIRKSVDRKNNQFQVTKNAMPIHAAIHKTKSHYNLQSHYSERKSLVRIYGILIRGIMKQEKYVHFEWSWHYASDMKRRLTEPIPSYQPLCNWCWIPFNVKRRALLLMVAFVFISMSPDYNIWRHIFN